MKNSSKLFLFSLLCLSLLPYFILCFCALPFADDFCFGWTASENIPFLQKFLKQYLNWNGRYTSDVLINLHPIVTGKILNYQIVLFASAITTPLVLFYFIQHFIKDKFLSALSSLLITLFYFSYMPDKTSGLYWYGGIVNYHIGNICVLLQIIFFLKLNSARGKTKLIFQILCLLLLLFSIGFNEVAAVIIPIAYFILSFSTGKLVWVYTTVAIISSAFVFFSPGNLTRASEFQEHYQLFHSLLYSSLQTVRFIVSWSFNFPFVLLSFLAAANAYKLNLKFPSFTYHFSLFTFLFPVFTACFLPYFATGILGQHRTLNYALLFFILGWLFFLLTASQKYNWHERFKFFQNRFVINVVLISSVLVLIITQQKTIFADWANGRFKKYRTELLARQYEILKNPSAPIQPLQNIPATFSIADTKADTTYWIDNCMRKMYSETKIELK